MRAASLLSGWLSGSRRRGRAAAVRRPASFASAMIVRQTLRRLGGARPPDDVAAGLACSDLLPTSAPADRRPGTRPSCCRRRCRALRDTSGPCRRAAGPASAQSLARFGDLSSRRAMAHSRRTAGDRSRQQLSRTIEEHVASLSCRASRMPTTRMSGSSSVDRRLARSAAPCPRSGPAATGPGAIAASSSRLPQPSAAPAPPSPPSRAAPSTPDSAPPGSGSSAPRPPRRPWRSRTSALCTCVPGGATRKMRPRSMSRWACPPTPGSYQSATNSEPSGATHTSAGRNQLFFLLPSRMLTIVAL